VRPSEEHCKTEFDRARRQRAYVESPHFSNLRWEALERFLSLGFPESPIAEPLYTLAAQSTSRPEDIGEIPGCGPVRDQIQFTFVNGHYVAAEAPTASLPGGVVLQPLSTALEAAAAPGPPFIGRIAPFQRAGLVALNTALFADGARLAVPAHTVLDVPIRLGFISTGEADARPAMSHPRILIELGEGSRATVVESYAGVDNVQYFTNAVTEIVLGEHAALERCVVQLEGDSAFFGSGSYIVMDHGARCTVLALSAGGVIVHEEMAVALAGAGGQFALQRAELSDRGRVVQTHAVVEHRAPGCSSRSSNTRVLAGTARSALGQAVVTGSDAPGARVQQIERDLFLSRDASAVSVPRQDLAASGAVWRRRVVTRSPTEPRALSHALAALRRLAARAGVAPLFDPFLDRALHTGS
jgi:Fe-S cluster assembly protein SufD